MKFNFKLLYVTAVVAVLFGACSKDEVADPTSTVVGVASDSSAVSFSEIFDIKPTVRKKDWADEGPLVYDYYGNSYRTIMTDSQIWLAENMKTTKFVTKSTGIVAKRPDDVDGTKYGYYFYYPSIEPIAYTSTRALYSAPGHALADRLSGWHIPTLSDVEQLINFAGGPDFVIDNETLDMKLNGEAFIDQYGNKTFESLGQSAAFWIQDGPSVKPYPYMSLNKVRTSTYITSHPYPELFYAQTYKIGDNGETNYYLCNVRFVKNIE